MAYPKGTKWGELHPNAKLFALRCRFADLSGAAFREVSAAAQQVRATPAGIRVHIRIAA